MDAGNQIREWRWSRNMTQDELAIAVGYKSRSTIAKIESGERDPYQSMVVALANALDTTPAYLMGWEDENGDLTVLGQLGDSYEKQELLKTLRQNYKLLQQAIHKYM